jgi:hypothetical protein
MSKRIHAHVRSNVVGYIALFCFAIGGTAFAIDGPLPGVNQVGSEDIINGEVQTADLGQAGVTVGKLASESVNSAKVVNGSLTGTDIAGDGIGAFDINDNAFRTEDIRAQFTGFGKAYGIPANAIQGDEISDATVTRADLNAEAEGPAGFQKADDDTGIICNDMCAEGSITLPAGFYAIFANLRVLQFDEDETLLRVECELNDGGTRFAVALFKVSGETGGLGVRPTVATISAQGVRLLTSARTLDFNCEDDDIGNVHGADLQITAIKLGSLTSPGP